MGLLNQDSSLSSLTVRFPLLTLARQKKRRPRTKDGYHQTFRIWRGPFPLSLFPSLISSPCLSGALLVCQAYCISRPFVSRIVFFRSFFPPSLVHCTTYCTSKETCSSLSLIQVFSLTLTPPWEALARLVLRLSVGLSVGDEAVFREGRNKENKGSCVCVHEERAGAAAVTKPLKTFLPFLSLSLVLCADLYAHCSGPR